MSSQSLFKSAREQLLIERQLRTYSFQSLMLDMAIGAIDPITYLPGVRERTIMEIFGPNQTGKTLLAENLMESVLTRDPNFYALFLSTEESKVERFMMRGLDIDRIRMWNYSSRDSKGELIPAISALDMAAELIYKDKDCRLVIIDSVKALTTPEEQKKDVDDRTIAVREHILTSYLRKHLSQNNSNAICLLINQTSQTIKTMGRNPEVGYNFKEYTSGGLFSNHVCDVRIDCDSTLIEGKEKHSVTQMNPGIGYNFFFKLIKNKCCKSNSHTTNRRAVVEFYFDRGRFFRGKEVLDIAEHLGIIQQLSSKKEEREPGKAYASGHYYYFGDESINGYNNACEWLDSDPKGIVYREELEKLIVPRGEEFFSIPGTTNKKKAKELLDGKAGEEG